MPQPLPAYQLQLESRKPPAVPSLVPEPPVRLVSVPKSIADLEEPDQDEDAACVRAARTGDHRAFESLVVKHQAHALAIAYGLLKDEHDAREVVQEAFLRVHRGLPNFQGTSSFFTWLYRIVTNLSIDLIRKPSRREVEGLDAVTLETASDVPCLANLDSDPFENLCRSQLVVQIDEKVRALPSYHQGVILMREIEGMNYDEMAVEMGVSKGTIMSRLYHARQKLQRSLFAEYQEYLGEPIALAHEPGCTDSTENMSPATLIA